MIHLLIGLVALALGIWGMAEWWDDFGEFMRGFVPIFLVFFGLAAVGAGFRRVGDNSEWEEDEEEEEEEEEPEEARTPEEAGRPRE